MFDISWTEFLLIGIVALVVIGPKELPGVMRTMGQWTRKLRGMAAEFQNQFNEALREAEMADLKKQVDDIAQDVKAYDPLKTVRDDVDSAGKDIEKSLAADPPAATLMTGQVAPPASAAETSTGSPEPTAQIPQPAGEFPLPEVAAELASKDIPGMGTAPVAPEAVADVPPPRGPERPE